MNFNLTISTTTPEDDVVNNSPDTFDSDNETEMTQPKIPMILPISISVSTQKPKRPFKLPNIKTTVDLPNISTTNEESDSIKRRPMIPSLISIDTMTESKNESKSEENESTSHTPVHTENSILLSNETPKEMNNSTSSTDDEEEEENKNEAIPLDLDELITRLTNNNCNYHRSYQIYGCPRNAHEFASNPDKYRNSNGRNIFSFANLFSRRIAIDCNEEKEEELPATENKSTSEEEMEIPWNIEISMNEREIEQLCHTVRDIFYHQPMLLHLEAPLRVVGDIHGQYFDLLRIFEYNGYPQPPFINYLFLGDYVDRGKLQMETIVLLFAFKCKYPQNFFLLRGNHESENVNRTYGFYDECKRRFSVQLWRVFCDVFNCLPVCAVIDEKIICMHGGLSPELKSLKKISRIHRPTEIPNTGGLLCDLLWSDPDPDISGWENNERGISWIFGADIVTKFLRKHDLDLIARAHQVVEDGYELFANRKLVTVFSAPAYCGEYDNCAAVMTVNKSLMCSFQILKPTNYRKRNSSSYTEEEDEDDDGDDDEEEGNGDGLAE